MKQMGHIVCDERINEERYARLLESIRDRYLSVLGDNLVGIYVHGSTALGSFMWDRSDIDVFVVVHRGLTYDEKVEFMKETVHIYENGNPKGIEMSIVLEEYCKNPVFPTPFDLHFSNGTIDWYRKEPDVYCRNMNGTDPDLGSYMAVIKQCGIVIYGAPINEVFGELPEKIYLDSVFYDINEANEDYINQPMYHTLNLCRTFAYTKDHVIRSKRGGGEWGLENLPEKFHSLIAAALHQYNTGESGVYEKEMAEEFCSYIFNQLDDYLEDKK